MRQPAVQLGPSEKNARSRRIRGSPQPEKHHQRQCFCICDREYSLAQHDCYAQVVASAVVGHPLRRGGTGSEQTRGAGASVASAGVAGGAGGGRTARDPVIETMEQTDRAPADAPQQSPHRLVGDVGRGEEPGKRTRCGHGVQQTRSDAPAPRERRRCAGPLHVAVAGAAAPATANSPSQQGRSVRRAARPRCRAEAGPPRRAARCSADGRGGPAARPLSRRG